MQPQSPQELIEKLAAAGIKRVLLALDPLREQPRGWSRLPALAEKHGVKLVAGMFGCVGEDYTTLESIRKTGGIVPDATWDQNWKHVQQTVKLAKKLGFKIVMFHAGFLPHEESDPNFAKLVERLRKIAGAFAKQGIQVAFETGQEPAESLSRFLVKLGCKNVGVNFDPANMLLYNNGDPIKAMKLLGPWIKQIHLKDANVTKQPGTWGEEVVLGTGQVKWKAFFKTLEDIGFKGNLFIEREAGTQRVEDIRTAREYVEKLCR
ncbi:MAG: sugar phosphate isomerase/epimerase family protein [Verrucomicrobiota bacterium]